MGVNIYREIYTQMQIYVIALNNLLQPDTNSFIKNSFFKRENQ